MGKSQVPKGATKKIKCKCGRLFYQELIGNSIKLTEECSLCRSRDLNKK